MAKFLSLSFVIGVVVTLSSQNVNLELPTSIRKDGASPDPSAILDIQSNDQGVLMPRMTFEQIKGIIDPHPGLMVYDLEFRCLRIFDGSRWVCLTVKNAAPFEAPGDLHAWSGGGAGTDELYSMTTDPSGNIYVTGSITGPASFGDTTVNAAGSIDFFLAKYLSNGTLIWFVSSQGPGASAGTSVTTDGQGNIYLAGAFAGTITIADSTLVSTNSSFDTFILKFNGSGTLLKALKIGGSENVFVNALTLDGSGNLLAVLDFKGQVNLSGNIFNSLEASDILLAKFDPNINIISWAQQAGGTANDIATSIVTDGSNNVYLTGIFFGMVTFGITVLDAGMGGAGEFFLAKYNSLGNFQWAIQEGSASQPEKGNDIAIDSNGDLIVTGSFSGSADFSGTILNSFGSLDIFLASYDTDGVLQWIKQAGGTSDDEANSVTINSIGEIFLTGTFQNQADFGSASVSTQGFQALFLAKCDASGVFEWVLTVDGGIKGIAVQADNHDNIIIAGIYLNSILFGNTTITSVSGSQDIFIAKYSE